MLSAKKNILQTIALLKAYNINQIVLSPGSRNAPIIQTFTQDSFFNCHLIVDERNAAFYALGIIQCLKQPVAICCTSGTALLNYAPAVAEAYYQQLPLVVISADRATEWIGQMDGQTISQQNVFGTLVKKSVHLPEIKTDTEEWYCNRMVNEALIACTANTYGPVHINVPLSEPLFDYSAEKLPEARKINYFEANKIIDIKPFAYLWNASSKKMIIVGQMFQSPKLLDLLEKLVEVSGCVVLSEHLANCNSKQFVHNFDPVLYTLDEGEKDSFAPDLLLTFGGHIVSKRIKQLLRSNKPDKHWHLSKSNEVVDLYQSLTDLVEVDIEYFLSQLIENSINSKSVSYSQLWQNKSEQVSEPNSDDEFSDIYTTGQFLKRLPDNSKLILANSSAIRNAQLYPLNESINIYCNRGTNGIEGTLASAVGFASVCDEPVYLIIGDLSFFFGLNALWNIEHIKNLRILLINNGGGSIFHTIPGLNKSESLREYVSAGHHTEAKDWLKAASLKYLSVANKKELAENLDVFMDRNTESSILMEVLVDMPIGS